MLTGNVSITDASKEQGEERVTEREFEKAVKRIRNGDKDGLKEIYLAYGRFIYAVIYEILGNREDTEDVTSEFFIKLWDVAESYRPGNGHKGYLATIARNMAIDWIRKHRREIPADPPELLQEEAMAETVENVVADMAVQEALATLKTGERQIVNLKILGGLTFREIAKVLQMPMGTVTWKYQNAITKLRRCGYE